MAGYWPLSRSVQPDLNGNPQIGLLAYFYEAGTLDAMTVYQDSGLALTHANPVVSDAYGRFPSVYLDDASFSFYRERVTTATGTLLWDENAVPIIGQQTGEGGAETPIDPNAVFQTGEVFWKYGTGTRAGAVRLNGRTVGSASSGASERANADTQPLFEHLWGADSELTVSSGRGGSASADFAANKTIALPDARRAALFGLSDMGNSALSGMAGGTTIGRGAAGEETHTLLTAEMAAHTHGAGSFAAASHRHLLAKDGQSNTVLSSSNQISRGTALGSAFDYDMRASSSEPDVGRSSLSGALAVSGTSSSSGSGAAHNNMPPFLRGTWYVKL